MEETNTTKFNTTDQGNVERLINMFGFLIRYCLSLGGWLVWNDKYWEFDTSGRFDDLVKKTIRSIFSEAGLEPDDEERKRLAKHALQSEDIRRYTAVESLARKDGRVLVSENALDADGWLLNCGNGTINLKTGELQPHNPDDLITKIVPVEYSPDATCPTWEKFMNDIMGGASEMVRYLQRVIGYSLTASTKEQCFFILYGTGANGKSTLLNIVLKLLSGYAKQAVTESFLSGKRGSINNDIAMLKGVRLAAATEFDEGQKFSEGLIKHLTGSDPIRARFLHKEFFEFIPTFKLFLATNHKPNVTGTDHGFWRRVRVIPFRETFSSAQIDPELSHKLIKELPGILAWAVRGCLDWQEYGLGEPQAVREATTQYRMEMDTVARFIEESCEVGPGQHIASSQLYSAYTSWCFAEGERVGSQKWFGMQLKKKGFNPCVKGGARCWDGIRMKTLALVPSQNLPMVVNQ